MKAFRNYTSSPPLLHYGWVIVAASFFIAAIAFGTQYTFGVFFKPLQQEFGWSRAATSGAISLNLLFYGIFAFLGGWATDRFGPRWVVALGGFLVGLGLLLSSQVDAIWQLYLLYSLPLALGLGAAWNPLVTTASRWFRERRGLALGIIAAGVGTGTLVMLPLTNYLISTYSWRTSFLILALLTWMVILPAALFLRKEPREAEKPLYMGEGEKASPGLSAPGNSGREFTVRQALQTRNLPVLFIMQALCTLTLRMVMVHVVPYATDPEIDMPSSVAALMVGLIGGFSILGRISMGSAQDRTGARTLFIWCSLLQSLSLLWLVWAREVWMFYVFAAVFGFTYGGDVPQFPALIGESFGLRHMGAIYGIVTLAVGIGGSVGPVLAGYIFDISGGYSLAFFLGAVAMLLAAGVGFLLQSPEVNSKRHLGVEVRE